MRNWMTEKRAAWPLVLGAFLVLILGAGRANAQFFGLDVEGDLDCEANMGDMGQVWTSGDLDSIICFDLVVDDFTALDAFGLSWCVRDKNKINFESFTYSAPIGWATDPLLNSEDNPLAVPIDAEYSGNPAYQDKILCWVASGTDYSGTLALTTFPAAVGTFCYTLTGTPDLKVGFVCQAENSGYFDFSLGAHAFTGEDEICPGATSVDQDESWGSIKKLFR